MTLREEIEILRGEPIQVFMGDPMAIPCVEMSDPKRLCKRPVVSVPMLAYNHEPYIRQAIEGVMMQKTDFEFELVIGEDCSTDKTREICFEYQKKFPDKIRVLWSEKNTYKNPHRAGRNSHRVTARCRGEYVAICEGDDYWIDPCKLQKQVDAFRKNQNIGLCYTDNWCVSGVGEEKYAKHYPRPVHNVVAGREFLIKYATGAIGWGATATVMYRKSALDSACSQSQGEIYSWRLRLGDKTLFLLCASVADVCYLEDRTAVYRESVGIMSRDSFGVGIDGACVSYYFLKKFNGSKDDIRKARQLAVSARYQRLPWLVWKRRVREAVCLLRESMAPLSAPQKAIICVLFMPLMCPCVVCPLIRVRRKWQGKR